MSSSDSISTYTWTTDEFNTLSLSSYLSPSPLPHPSGNPFLAPRDIKPPHHPAERVHLLSFWLTHLAAWFGATVAAFRLRRVIDGRDKFSYVMAVPHEDQLIQEVDLLEVCPLLPDAFDCLMLQLIQIHTLD